jgi:hypothetical protein
LIQRLQQLLTYHLGGWHREMPWVSPGSGNLMKKTTVTGNDGLAAKRRTNNAFEHQG